MGIGPDIRDVFREVGIAIDITHVDTSAVTSGEYIMTKNNSQATKPFIREYFLEAEFPFDTVAKEGDIVQFINTGSTYHQIMNLTPEAVENDTYKMNAVLYKCNFGTGKILRMSGERSTTSYQKTPYWATIKDNCFGLITEPVFYKELDSNAEIGLAVDSLHEIYIPKEYAVQLKDRIEPYSGEFYMVQTILNSRYVGSDVLIVSEDTR